MFAVGKRVRQRKYSLFASKSDGTRSSTAWLSQASTQMKALASPSKLAVRRLAKLQIGASMIRHAARYTPVAARRVA